MAICLAPYQTQQGKLVYYVVNDFQQKINQLGRIDFNEEAKATIVRTEIPDDQTCLFVLVLGEFIDFCVLTPLQAASAKTVHEINMAIFRATSVEDCSHCPAVVCQVRETPFIGFLQ